MKFEIKTIGGSLLFEGDFSCIADAVSAAVAKKANLRYANLSSANLSYANLSSANLSSADLSYANLSSADLRYANLRSADLRYANLSSADLRSANLRYANLSSADLRSANLSSAKNAELAIAMTRILAAGDLIGWKKSGDGAIIRVSIPAAAKRSHAFGRKCRAEFVRVLEILRDDKPSKKPAHSHFDSSVIYKVGEEVRPSSWCEDFTQECAGGIHFFITKEEAVAYDL